MFKHLTLKEQLQRVQRKNQALTSYTKDLEDALVELAEVITEEGKDNG